MIQLQSVPEGTILPVRAHASARQTGPRNIHDGALRIDITAAPEKGKANKAIVAVLSDLFDLPKSAIELISGPIAAQKKFLLHGLPAKQVLAKINQRLNESTQ